MALRTIMPPKGLGDLGLPALVESWLSEPRGLVLIAGAPRSGRTTTLTAMLTHICATSARLIVTLEGAVEYFPAPSRSVVVQHPLTEVETGVQQALALFPQVLAVERIEDATQLASLLEAAQSCLVLATVEASSVENVLARMVEGKDEPRQAALLAELALHLKGIVVQRLLPGLNPEIQVLATELLTPSRHVRRLLRERRLHELRHVLWLRREGSQALQHSILALVQSGTIEATDASIELSALGGG